MLNTVRLKFTDPKYNYATSVSADATEQSCIDYFVGTTFDLGHYPKIDNQKCIAIEFVDNNAPSHAVVNELPDVELDHNAPIDAAYENITEDVERYFDGC